MPSYPYPIKNWKKPSDYPTHSNMDKWAWEFLRRNIGYQRDIDNYIELQKTFSKLNDKEKIKFNQGIGDTKRVCVKTINYPKGRDGWIPLHKVLQKKYSITALGATKKADNDNEFYYFPLPSPKTDIDHIGIGKKAGMSYSWWSNKYNEQVFDISLKNKNEILIKFDLDIPIKNQIEQATRILLDHAEINGITQPNKKKLVKKYPFYIRILDALAEKVSPDDIASTLYPYVENRHPDFVARKRVLQQAEAAKKLSNMGYIELNYL